MIGRGDLLKGAGAALLAVAAPSVNAKKGNKKKKRCPKAPRCPESCAFLNHGPNGEDICGIGTNLNRDGGSCIPCTSDSDCVARNIAFPHCLTSSTIISNNQTRDFTDICGPYPAGVCGVVSACVT